MVNSIGTPIHTKVIDFEPICYGINKTRVYVASTDTVLYYQFKSSTNGSNIAYNSNYFSSFKKKYYTLNLCIFII